MDDGVNNSAGAGGDDVGHTQFPYAQEIKRPTAVLGLTKLWWLALACLLLAVGLTISSLPAKGKMIAIKFLQGHGLKAEDAVRFRGIDVGFVESIHLSKTMDAVEVDVRLLPSAAALAVEGARFWIVRPQLSISGVSGLETAVGHKYIEVIPGDQDGARQNSFDGLAQAPADSASSGGVEILLQADQRHSVSAGSAVHYRGIDVGKVLGISLATDARHVEVRVRIFENYRSLVTTASRFWATGGVDFDFSLREGLKLETESLDTLARGGVSMLVVGEGRAVDPGHVFQLAASVGEDWRAQSDGFLLAAAPLRGAVNFEATWKEKVLFRDWKKTERFSGAAMTSPEDKMVLVFPSDILKLKDRAVEGSFSINVTDLKGQRFPIVWPPQAIDSLLDDNSDDASQVAHETLMSVDVPAGFEWAPSQFLAASRESFAPRECLAVRRSGDSGMLLHLPIKTADISLVDEEGNRCWQLENVSGDRDVWHGCPVVDATGSSCIGILLIDNHGPRVHPLAPLSLQ